MSTGFGGAVKLTGESEYRKALRNITQNLREVASEMNVVSSSFSKNDKSTEALTAKQNVLNQKLSEQTNKLNTLKAQYESMSSQYATQTAKHEKLVNSYNAEKETLSRIGDELGTTSKEYQDQKSKVDSLASAVQKSTANQDANSQSMSKMRVQINNAQSDCNNTKKAIDDLGKELDETGKSARNTGDGFTVFKGVVANLTATAITKAISGLKRLGEQLINIGKQSYSAYGEYEQLVGGVETLFKDSSGKLMEYANVAYKTAGISANQYMEQATSFSATLLQGLGGDTRKAVEYANMAIIDMSDNANKMGTDMSMIQNAYQGFAKDNYTMLDNLKLGYGGTAGEMARLVNDSGVLGNAVKVTAEEVKNVPFDKIIEAIHKTQQEIGITGTTSLEAATTLQGSAGSVKAAWSNLLVGIADDNQDLSQLWRNLWESLKIAVSNAVPKIKNIIKGMKDLIKEIIPEKTLNNIKTFAKVIGVVVVALKSFQAVIKVTSTIAAAQKALVAYQAAAGSASIMQGILNGQITLAHGIIGTLTNKMILAEVAQTAMAKAQAIVNAVMSANPIMLVVTAVAALAAGIGIYKLVTMESTEETTSFLHELSELDEKMSDYNERLDELKETRKKTIEDGIGEMNYYKGLKTELDGLIDANGKVKNGYEERAGFIVSTLNDALGTELKMTDGVIKNYDQISNSIDKVIKKKQAEIILNAYEEEYAEAIKARADMYQQLILQEEQVAAREEALRQAKLKGDEEYIASCERALEKEQEKLDSVKENLEESTRIIGNYEGMKTDIIEGNADKVIAAQGRIADSYYDTTQINREELEKQITDTRKKKDEALKIYKESGDKIYKTEADNYDKQLVELEKQLKAVTKTIQGSDIEASAKSTAEKMVKAFGNKDFSNVGENIVLGVKKGMTAVEPGLYNKAKNIANNALKSMKSALGIHSPSRVFENVIGKNMILGLSKGLTGNENVAIDAIKKVSNDITESASSTIRMPQISAITAEITPYNNVRPINNNISKGDNFTGVIDVLNRYLPELVNRQIVLDSGVVVGGLMPEIDNQMGKLIVSKKRGQ